MCACGRHHRQTQSFSPLSQPPLCPGVLHGLGGGAQVGALCFVRLSLYCTSLLSLSWFSSLLLENGIDLLKITRSQHQPPSSSDPAPGPSRPTALCPPSGPWVPLHTCCPDSGGIVLGRALPGPSSSSSLSLARAWSRLPRRSLGSHRRDPHDQLSAAALRGPLFMRSQVTQDVQDGVSTVVIGQGA